MRSRIGTYDGGVCSRLTRVTCHAQLLRGGAIVCSSLALCAVCVGCGTGVAARPAAAKRQRIALTSPSIVAGGRLQATPTVPVRYTCDGSDTTPSFAWGPVPSSAAELALFMLKVTSPTPSSGGGVQVSVEWAVAGLSPSVHALAAGKLPQGAVVAGKPYSICPPKGSSGTYVFQLSAVAQPLAVAQQYGPAGLFQEAEGSTVAVGNFTSTYKRK